MRNLISGIMVTAGALSLMGGDSGGILPRTGREKRRGTEGSSKEGGDSGRFRVGRLWRRQYIFQDMAGI